MRGVWHVGDVEHLMQQINQAAQSRIPASGRQAQLVVDCTGIVKLDTGAAWGLSHARDRLLRLGVVLSFEGMDKRLSSLMELVSHDQQAEPPALAHPNRIAAFVEDIGASVAGALGRAVTLIGFLGQVILCLALVLRNPLRRLRLNALSTQMVQTGWNALPIVGLLSFMIGIVLAYLMSDQLQRFGAEIFTVNLIGLAILREIAVLLTAILIAGRSGSSFTAELGTMKVNEEIDAMQVLGLDPIEVLVLPRMLALLITLPILTLFADITGILGGAMMTILALDLTLVQFVNRLHEAVGVDHFLIGLVKAPVHAVIIAVVGCYEGLQTKRSAESVGRQTTVSVVESIFLVMIATACFAVLFSMMGL